MDEESPSPAVASESNEASNHESSEALGSAIQAAEEALTAVNEFCGIINEAANVTHNELMTVADCMPPAPPTHHKTVRAILGDWYGFGESPYRDWGGIRELYGNPSWRRTLQPAEKKRVQRIKYVANYGSKYALSRKYNEPTSEDHMFELYHQSRKSASNVSLQGLYNAITEYEKNKAAANQDNPSANPDDPTIVMEAHD
jgi:hypothetical protein